MTLARSRPLMSEALKYEIAREMGVDDIVAREGWGSVSSRECGNLVKMALLKAEQQMSQENEAQE